MWPLSDDRFAELLHQVQAVFYADSHEPTPRTLYLSSNAELILGAGAEDHLRDPDLWWRSIHPDDMDQLLEAWSNAFRTLQPYQVDYRYLRPDGRTVWLREHAAPVRDADGSVMHWQGVLLDVTAEHEALAELRGSERRYRALVEQLPAFVYAISDDEDFVNLFGPSGGAEILGYDPDGPEWSSMTWADIVHPDDRERARAAWRHSLDTGEPFDLEFRQVNSRGETLWVHDHAILIRDADRRSHWQGVVIDVTGRVTAEHEARGAERRFATLEAQLPVVVYAITDALESKVLYCSPNAKDVLGHPAEDYVSGVQAFPDFVHHEDRDAAFAAWEAAWRSHNRYESEYRMVRPDGSTIWIRETAEPTRGPHGKIEFWQGAMLDVTREHLARLELEESEARRRALIENLPAVVYEMAHDDDRRTLYISAGIVDLLDYTHREWLDQPDIWSELLHPDDREVELAAHDLHSETGEPWSREYRLIAADGRVVWVRDVARLVAGPSGVTWQGLFVDISAQKLAEEALHLVKEELEARVQARTAEIEEANALLELEVGERRRAEREARRAEERFRRLVENLPAVVYRWDVPDEIVTGDEYVSPGIGPLLGYTPEEWRSEHLWQQRLHPHDRDRVHAAVTHSEATGETFDEEYRYLAKDGKIVWVHDRATLLARHPDGSPASFQGVVIDITSRRVAEQQAAEAEAKFREYIEGGPLISYSYRLASLDHPAMQVDYVSPQLGLLLGYPTEDLASRPERWFEPIHPDDVERARTHLASTWSTGAPWDVRYRMIRADGEIVWFRSRGRCVERDQRGRPVRFVGAMTDETADMATRLGVDEDLAHHRDVIAGTRAILWTVRMESPDGPRLYTYISPECFSLLGYTPEELMVEREHFPRLVHVDDVDRVLATSAAIDTDPEGIWEDEYRVVHRDGSVRWMHGIGRRVTPLGEHPAIWHGITIDVTHRHVDETASSAPRTADA